MDFRLIFIGDATQTAGATNKLKQAVKSGQVGDLEVDPNSFNITKIGKEQRLIYAVRVTLKTDRLIFFVIFFIDGGNAKPQSGGNVLFPGERVFLLK